MDGKSFKSFSVVLADSFAWISLGGPDMFLLYRFFVSPGTAAFFFFVEKKVFSWVIFFSSSEKMIDEGGESLPTAVDNLLIKSNKSAISSVIKIATVASCIGFEMFVRMVIPLWLT
ncbi:MAG: hypothetical protein WCP55_12050 [Lentisphaerota bacterium]